MALDLAHAAGFAVRSSLSLYYRHEALRQASAGILPDHSNVRSLLFLRGMMHFEPGPQFRDTFRKEGFRFETINLPWRLERNLFCTPWGTSGVVLRTLAARPVVAEDRPIFVGHSAGGLAVYLLAATVKGGNREAIRAALPREVRPTAEEMCQLAERFSNARFITIATPHTGITMTGAGAFFNNRLVEPNAPELFTAIANNRLAQLYADVGLRPEAVIDGNLYGTSEDCDAAGNLASRAANQLAFGALRFFHQFVGDRGPSDGIVPVASAILPGPLEATLPINHLRLVESEAAAQVVIGMIRTLGIPAAAKLS